MRASEIRWGAGYENALHFDPFPTDTGERPRVLDDATTWRRPAPGSERVRNDAGVTDAWLPARDYLLAGVARYFGRQAWSANGLQAFLDWAGEGNTFRLIPDRQYPSFYVDGCYLDEPFDNPRPHLEDSDGSQSIEVTIRQQSVDFGPALAGVMFEYVPGMDLTAMGGTFTRATTATYVDRNGVVRTAATGVLRDAHYIGGYRHTLLEKGSTNLVVQSESLGGPAPWTADGTPTRTGGPTTAGIALFLIGDDSAVDAEAFRQDITFTGDGVKAISFFIKEGTSSSSAVRLFDSTAGQERGLVAVSWSGGLPVVATGGGAIYLGYEELADGTFRIFMQTASVTAANTHVLIFYPAQVANLGGAANTGNVYFGGPQAENSPYPTSYLATTTAAVTRNADEVYASFAHAPQELTMYAKFNYRGDISSDARIAQIGGNTPPWLALLSSSGFTQYRANHQNGLSGGESEAFSELTPPFDAIIELRAMLDASTGIVSIAQSTNGGAEGTTDVGADPTGTVASAWSQTRVYLGGNGGPAEGVLALQSLRIMAGTQTLATIRSA